MVTWKQPPVTEKFRARAESPHLPPPKSYGKLPKWAVNPAFVFTGKLEVYSYSSTNATKSLLSVNAPDTPDEDDKGYPSRWRLGSIVVALCLAVFCMALDNTIIATAIPKITDQFNSLDDVAWYGSAYLLTTCSFQLFFGRLYTFFPIKWVYLVAVALFELGSLLCGVAPSSVALIVGRAIAGIGSAGIFSGSILIIAVSVPLRQRPLYTGIIASMYGIASVAGPLLGGVFTDHITWRWCFYINLPIGAVTVIFLLLFFQNPRNHDGSDLTWLQKLGKLDLPGTAVFIPAIVCLLLALQWGGLVYPWGSGRVVALLVVFSLLMITFVGIQWWQQDDGTVPPRIFLKRSVAGAVWFAVTFGGSFFILVYYVPIWFQSVKQTSATQSGIDSLPLVLTVAVFTLISGVGVTVFGYYTPWMLASSVFMAVGSGLVSTFHDNTGTGKWVGYQIVAGIGYGLGIQIPLIVVQAVLPLADIPIGIAMIMFSQTFGGALFIAAAQNVFLIKLTHLIQKIFPNFTAQQLFNLGATSLQSNTNPVLLKLILPAYNTALQSTFQVAIALGALSIIGAAAVEWKSVKGQFFTGGG